MTELMLTTVKGTYENGRVFLDEPLPIPYAKVIVTVLEENDSPKKARKAGTMKGEIWMSEDFDDSLDELNDYV